jgi:hypothetical protein
MLPCPIHDSVALLLCHLQVLFTLNNIGIADLLKSGPRSAADLAAALGPSVNPEWVERVLAAGYALDMLGRVPAPRGVSASSSRSSSQQQEGVTCAEISRSTSSSSSSSLDADVLLGGEEATHASNKVGSTNPTAKSPLTDNDIRDQDPVVSSISAVQEKSSTAVQDRSSTAVQPVQGFRPSSPYLYKLNAVSAVLSKEHPASMSSFVRHFEDHYRDFVCLTEGVMTGKVPFQISSGGKSFWEYLAEDKAMGAVFDESMRQMNSISAEPVLGTYPWSRIAAVVDVAGGVGGFMLPLLERFPSMRSWVLDLEDQVQRGQKVSGRRGPLAAHYHVCRYAHV